MASTQLRTVVCHLRRLADPGHAGEPADQSLLQRFTEHGDEAAFRVLLERHGPGVLRVCRGVLHDQQDAEDAFQATFLTLARKAASIRKPAMLACWLHGVARRVALKTRRTANRRAQREARALPPTPADPLAEITARELCAALDEELAGLPESLRAPLLLCCLEGLTRDEAARRLGWSLATLKRRLARGRTALRQRLTRRGLSLAAALAAPSLARAALSPVLSMITARAVSRSAARTLHSPRTAAVLLATSLCVGGLLAAGSFRAPPEQRSPAPSRPATEGRGPRADLFGDPLPPGALARCGTVRLRHGDSVSAVAFSADGKLLASVGWDGPVRLWDFASGKELRALHGQGRFTLIGFPPGGKTLAVLLGSTFEMRDLLTGKVLRRFTPAGGTTHCALSPDGKVLATGEWKAKEILLSEVASGKELRRLPTNEVLDLTFAPDGKTVAAVGADSTVRLWETAGGREVRRLDAPVRKRDDHSLALRFSPDGRMLVLGEGQAVRRWDLAGGKELPRLEGHRGEISSVAFSLDGKLLASGARDNTVRLWDTNTGKLLHTFRGHRSWVQCVAFSPDGKTLVSGAQDHTVRLWNVRSGKELRPLAAHENSIFALALSSDGRTLATGGADETLRLWDATTGRPKRRLAAGDWITCLAFSPDGKLLAAGSSDFKAVCLWDVAAGKELRRCLGHEDPIWSVAFSPDGRTLVSGSDDGTVRLWDVGTGKERLCLRGHTRDVRAVAFAPDGRSVASGGFDGAVRVWDAHTGKGRLIGKHGHIIFSVAFAPDGRKLASAGKDDPVRLWDVAAAKQIREFERQQTRKPRKMASTWMVGPGGKLRKIEEKDLGRDRTVHGVAFSPDGRTLATAESDHSVFLWEVETGKPRRDLEGHRGDVFAVAFAADGRTLASAGYDLTALVWDVTGRPKAKGPPRRLREKSSARP